MFFDTIAELLPLLGFFLYFFFHVNQQKKVAERAADLYLMRARDRTRFFFMYLDELSDELSILYLPSLSRFIEAGQTNGAKRR